jgi:excisionase family DNA binding protein
MKLIERTPEILTPEQAAEYLQVDRETIYRYIRQGKLVASNLGRTYRIPKRSLDLLLWATRTRQDVTLREYTGEQIEEFINADKLDEEAGEIARRFTKALRRRSTRGSDKVAGLSQPV